MTVRTLTLLVAVAVGEGGVGHFWPGEDRSRNEDDDDTDLDDEDFVDPRNLSVTRLGKSPFSRALYVTWSLTRPNRSRKSRHFAREPPPQLFGVIPVVDVATRLDDVSVDTRDPPRRL